MLSIPLTVERSILIDKPASSVFGMVSDFNSWASWSPWLSQEPECPVTIEGNPGTPGHKQFWDGKKIGSGRMELVKVTPDQLLAYDLYFIKPWKSQAKASFTFEPVGNATKVTWSLDSSLPIFLFFMKKKMTAMIGSDYERGLGMLKEQLEASD